MPEIANTEEPQRSQHDRSRWIALVVLCAAR